MISLSLLALSMITDKYSIRKINKTREIIDKTIVTAEEESIGIFSINIKNINYNNDPRLMD
tara:strand:+ start:311 stop:493 length:183 start_codon:yes stop_codon:yes gene_type:complete